MKRIPATMLIVLAGCAVLATVGLLAYRARSEGHDEQVRKQMVSLMEQQRSANEAEKTELQKKMDQMSAQLGRGSAVGQKSQGGIYLVALHLPWGQEQGFCSAFAIQPDVLVTNSHCVAVAEEWQRKGARTAAISRPSLAVGCHGPSWWPSLRPRPRGLILATT